MSVRAEILRLGLRNAKKWHIRERVAVPTGRSRLKRIESLVPRPPAGTQTTAIDAGGVNAVRVAVRQARSDRSLLRLSARPRASVPGGARGRGRGLSLARRPVPSPADRLH